MRRPKLCIVMVVAVVSVFAVVVSPALAESGWWKVVMSSNPTVLAPGGEARVIVQASNLGDGPVPGESEPVRIRVQLPSWLEVKAVDGIAGPSEPNPGKPLGLAGNMSCESPLPVAGSPLTCTYPAAVPAFGTLEMLVTVKVKQEAPASAVGEASVAGGETPEVSTSQTFTTGSSTPFGVERYELAPEGEGGSPDTQAGSHPFQLTSTIGINQKIGPGGLEFPIGPELVKDLNIDLPPGLVGNANLIAQCDEQQFTSFVSSAINLCPADTAVGVALVTTDEPEHLGYSTVPVPIFNLTPNPGEPARFGWLVEGTPVVLDTSVRTGSDYGVTVSASRITQIASFVRSEVSFWGVPGAQEHAASRGWACVAGDIYVLHYGASESEPCTEHEVAPKAFLTMPTSCSGSLQSSVEADSWEHPGQFGKTSYTLADSAGEPFALNGCAHLGFDPTISVAPDGEAASTPTGLTVGVHVPQEVSIPGAGTAEADVRTTTVALPNGVQLSPSAADGQQACSAAQIGYRGENPETHVQEFTPEEQSCPDASKVATVKIETPLLPHALEGAVYLASPQNFSVLFGAPRENPFESLVALYLVARDPVSGVLVKLPGKVSPDPVTGQLVSTFENTPQLPFENLELHFFGTDRAPLSTPSLCGTYRTTAAIVPWSSTEAKASSSSFAVTTGPDGTGAAGCTAPRQFAPGFNAQTTNIQAGAFTPFTLTMSRPDQDQTLGRVEVTTPPGLAGELANVKLCGEPQAAQGTCGPESEIGETTVSVGLGSDPFTVTGGRVYITTAYGGGEYGLSIVNPASAGPFVLQEGRPVIVRAAIYVDPHTAALRIVSDALPTIIDGIPLQIQHVNVTVNRAKFTFNPTSCNKLQVGATLSSSEGATATTSTPFQVTDCEKLAFKPKFTVSTKGKTTKAGGASLTAKLTYPAGSQGAEADIAKVKVDLPKQLPSRLTTLQKACTAKQFELNPANCPKESKIGYAKVTTPLLPVPLEGPAIFVSHGGEAFPSLTIVLQGYGVTVDLVGTTFISKASITSTTFKTVPDLPFNTFQLTLPQGKFSALGANVPEKDHGNLCGQKLTMPTAFVAQNGAEIKQSTKLSISGCGKVKKAKSKKRSKGKKGGKGKGKK